MGLRTHFFISINPDFLEEFKLLGGFGGINQFSASEYLHHPELLIGDAHNPHMPFRRQDSLNPFDMHVGILPAAAMAYIHAELKHRKTVSHDLLSEQGIVSPVSFGVGWQVKMY
jgi:hypothetical protein